MRNTRKLVAATFLLIVASSAAVVWYWLRTQPITASIKREEMVNTLEYIRESGFVDEQEASAYVISKYWLDSLIDDKQQVVDYLDSKQWDDGGWGYWEPSHLRPMMSREVLFAYFILNATPEKSLEPFLSQYDTWEEAGQYRNGRISSAYHLIFSWAFYYRELPSWLPEFFQRCENDLWWTTDPDEMHFRSHVLYSYIIARRPFPNIEGIIKTTIETQQEDGQWHNPYGSHILPETSIQLFLLSAIKLMYPHHERISEIEEAIARSSPFIQDSYRTESLGNKTCAYFDDGTPLYEVPKYRINNVFWGILGSILTGLTTGNADPLFDTLVSQIL